jgi:hypothetical protein
MPAKSKSPELPVTRLQELFSYDSQTGALTWRVRVAHRVHIGDLAGYVKQGRYRQVMIDGHEYMVARIAWALHYGEWPTSDRNLRFKDENPANCAIANIVYGETIWSDPKSTAAYHRVRRKKDPGISRRNLLKHHHGMDEAEYQRLFIEQDGKCAICVQPETEKSRWDGIKWLSVDHDHETGANRGLLCARCNVGVGTFQDDPARLRAAAAYLEHHASERPDNVVPLTGRKVQA